MLAEVAYLFRHAVLQEVAYGLQPPSERSRLHAAALVSIEKLYPNELQDYALELANHATRARELEPADSRTRRLGHKEAKYLQLAAESAYSRLDLGAAERLYGLVAACPFSPAHQRIAAWRKAAECAFDAGAAARASDYLHRGLGDARAQGERAEEARILLALARACAVLGKQPEAMTYGDQAQRLAASTQDAKLEFDVHHELGALQFQRGETAASVKHFDHAIEVARRLRLERELASALNRRGAASILIAEHEAAAAALSEALVIIERLGDRRLLTAVLGNQGVLARHMGRLDEAIAAYREAGRLSAEIGHHQNVCVNLDNLGIVLGVTKRLEEALQNHLEGIRMARELDLPNNEGMGMLNGSLILRHLGQLDAALEMILLAEDILRRCGNRRGVASSLTNRSTILLDMGRAFDALCALIEALVVFRDVSDTLGIVDTELRTQRVLMALGLHSEVRDRSTRMLEQFRNERKPEWMQFSALYWLAHSEEALGNTDGAKQAALTALSLPRDVPAGEPDKDVDKLNELLARLDRSKVS